MVGREEEDYPDEMEERLVNEEYKIWKKNTPFLYGAAFGCVDLCIPVVFDWHCFYSKHVCRSCHHTCFGVAQSNSTVVAGKLLLRNIAGLAVAQRRGFQIFAYGKLVCRTKKKCQTKITPSRKCCWAPIPAKKSKITCF